DRAALEFEAALALVVDRAARDVAGQQVGGELDAAEAKLERLAEQVSDQGLGEARIILDEDMSVGQDAGHDLAKHAVLADDDLGERLERALAALPDVGHLHRFSPRSRMRPAIASSGGPRPRHRRPRRPCSRSWLPSSRL